MDGCDQSFNSDASGSDLSVLLCTDYLPPSGGGVETVVETLAEELSEVDVQVSVFTLASGTGSFNLANHPDIDLFMTPTIDLTSKIGLQSQLSLAAFRQFRSIIQSVQPDIIHAHNRFFFTTLVAAIWKRLGAIDVPLVLTAHVGPIDGIEGLSGTAARTFERFGGRFVLRSSNEIIAVSQSVARHIRQFSNDEPVVIPNGVDTEHFHPGTNTHTHPRVLYVGRLVHNKGPQTFVESLPTIFERVPDAHADIVGPGQMRPELEERCLELDISERVTFHGYVDDIAGMMRAADVFCLPSFVEGLPLTLLEAMSSGLPPVVSAVGGIPDTVEDGKTGFLVSPGDPAEVATTVSELLEDSHQRERIGRAAREYVVANHSWKARTDEVLSLYHSVIERDSGVQT